MKTGELKPILASVPDDFDLSMVCGHSMFKITSVVTSSAGKLLTLHCDEKRDPSDPVKQGPQEVA